MSAFNFFIRLKNKIFYFCSALIFITFQVHAAQSFGEIAEGLTHKIYQTIPREKGEAMFTDALGFAKEQLISDVLKEASTQFASQFASSLVNNYLHELSPSLAEKFLPSDRQSLIQQIAHETQLILNRSQTVHQEKLNSSLTQCFDGLKTDAIGLVALGDDTGFTNSTALFPSTTTCLKEKSQLTSLFQAEIRPHERQFIDLLFDSIQSKL